MALRSRNSAAAALRAARWILLIRHDLVQQDPLQHDRAITSRDRADSTAATLISAGREGLFSRGWRRVAQVRATRPSLCSIASRWGRGDGRQAEKIPSMTGRKRACGSIRKKSPLAWLAARKGADGAPLIDAAQFEAGERFPARSHHGRNQCPGVSIDWDQARLGRGWWGRQSRRPARRNGGLHRRAPARDPGLLRHLGAEDGDLLIDVCRLSHPDQRNRAGRVPGRRGRARS